MAVQDIVYIEMYTRDKVSTVDHFVSAMGFTRVADSVEFDRSSALLRQGEVQLVVTSGRGVWKFLDQHGDGIADIAVACDDVTATLDAAVAAGAGRAGSAYGTPVVPGFGDVSHSLLPRIENPANSLPPGRRWVAAPEAPARPTGRIQRLDHVAIRLEGGSLGDHADFYRDAFGFSRHASEHVAVGDRAMDLIVVRSASERVTFTLAAPDPAKEPGRFDAFLERNAGEGVQHLAFLVEDIVPAVREFRDRGVEFLSIPDTCHDTLTDRFPELRARIAGLRDARVPADSDEGGHVLQSFSRSPYERNTLFYALIQRQGARGFGSAGIRALYEAVEREGLAAR
ncbi:VOC family protein [Streptomyces sp. NPDC000410]|uniref:VOC family protein n=1 Tax=Streptomyces sp. NPDC000410 TaxID=3154254 RepID=UPI00333087C7